MDLNAVREALATAIETGITGLRCYPRWPGSINPPCAIVVRRETQYDPAFDVDADTTLAVRVLLGFVNTQGGQEDLDDYLAPTGAKSIPAVINADPTLGGLVAWARPSVAEAELLGTFGGIDYLYSDIVVEVG